MGDLEKLPHQEDESNKLIGDVEALKYLDAATLEREGLGMYRHYLNGHSSSSTQVSAPSYSNSYIGNSQNYYWDFVLF